MADEPEITEHEPTEITYSEQFFPARPRALRPRGRLRPQGSPTHGEDRTGEPVGTNPYYVAWLQRSSMLRDANLIAAQFSGTGSMWQNPFANPDARNAISTAGVWFTAYPLSFMTKPGESFLGTLADPALWEAFEQIGIDALHTGPVKRAGGLNGWQPTPSVDGHFDRISTEIDAIFGTEDDFRTMCEVAAEHGGTIIDDIVPGHTGKGADFRLAEMGVDDYPGIYHMVQIEPEDWEHLPDVPPGRDSVNLDGETEDRLAKAGYIIGELQRVIFHDPGVKDTNWSVTAPVVGPDGIERRWVYLHYFKEGQPSINWLDPTFAGMRLVIGDALHSLGDLGSGALRLDANGFLGVEKSADGLPAWSEGHPLSEAANHLIASMVRKLGGFTFQELNLTIDDILETGQAGADLSYDFVNRPAYHHALAMQDSEFLRLTLNASLEIGVQPISLVHALQNHDELTYELVHFATRHKDDEYSYGGETITGGALAETGPGRADREADRPRGAVQRDLHDQRHRVDDREHHRRVARHHRPGRHRRRERRADQAGAPAAGEVQRLAAGGLRAVRLGPLRDAAAAPRDGRAPAPGRRHPLDPPRRLRPDGVRRQRAVHWDAARDQPLRDPARAAGRRDVLRLGAPGDPGRAGRLRHRDGHPGRRTPGLAPRHAGDGPRARVRPAAGDGPELRPGRGHRHGPLRAPRSRLDGGGHDHRRGGRRGRRAAQLLRHVARARGTLVPRPTTRPGGRVSDIVVADAPERHRFEITVDGVLAGFTQYIDKGAQRVFPHTEVKDEYAGQGLATTLIRAALDETRATGRPVVPLCPAVKRFIQKNPEYADLVPAERHAEFGL